MARYQVPQFIDIEDKIVGSLTVKQFLIFLSAAGVAFVLWTFLAFTYFLIAAIIVVIIAMMFSFAKINGRSFGAFMVNLQKFIINPQKYTWEKEKILKTKEPKIKTAEIKKTQPQKTIDRNKLKKLAWTLDEREDANQKNN